MACDFDGDTALHRAVREGHPAVVALLVRAGAAAGGAAARKNLEGLTAAQLAAKRGRPDVLAALDTAPDPAGCGGSGLGRAVGWIVPVGTVVES